ncbi:MAG: PAS domain-containing sensor histidine kinase [Tunicatimonas sp.]|uniref:sensor histidine kinase n=1 Tax=Tunicatimonas sp. TaxID=1940096 RepID=UPI003C7932A2
MITNLNKQIVDNEPEFFFIWDIGTQKIIHLADIYCENGAFKLRELTDHNRLANFFHPQDRNKFKAILRSFSTENALQDHDLRANHKKYEAKWLNLRSFLMEENGRQVAAHISNVTKCYEQLEALQKSSEWNSEIIHMLVHDLRNPLSSIQVLSNLAQSNIQEDDTSEGLYFLTLIDDVEEDATQLIDALLSLLELNDTKFTLERKPTNVSELIQSRVEHFAVIANLYAISLTTELLNEAIPISTDSRLLKQVIDNLIMNALKFTPAQGSVTVRLSYQTGYFTLSVQDSGIGIPRDKLPELFEKFTNARRLGIRGEKTSGLGLSIVKKITDMLKGKISVTSQEHLGSTFTVELPVN